MNDSICIVLFGATGDLARLKILPAIEILSQQAKLKLISVGRRNLTNDAYLQELANQQVHPFAGDLSKVDLEYIQLDHEQVGGFHSLWEVLQKGNFSQIIYYLAVAPDVSSTIFDRFLDLESVSARDALACPQKLLMEKPFGEDLADADMLFSKLNQIMADDVFFDDHYLHKPAVIEMIKSLHSDQNAMQRLQDAKEVKLLVSEAVDLGGRAGYFERRGMSVDWFQSHMLQIVSSACVYPTQRAEFISSLKLVPESVLRAQYDGYLQSSGVEPESQTETFLACKFMSNFEQYQGTLFTFVCGKAMQHKEVFLEISGSKSGQVTSTMKYSVDKMLSPVPPSPPVEFVDILQDVIDSDLTHFVTPDQIRAQWQVTEMLRAELPHHPLPIYPKGTDYQHFCTEQWCLY